VGIQRLEERHVPQLRHLLAQTFGVDVPSGFYESPFLRWKFFDPFPGWNASRSYVLCQEDNVMAHASLWPTVFQCNWAEVRCPHILDWAASPAAKGSGVAIYRYLMDLGDSAFVVGGSDHARRLLPRIGFKRYGTQQLYAKVIRPWTQFRSQPFSSPIRDLARLVRNIGWSVGGQRLTAGWSIKCISAPDQTIDELLSSWKPHSYCSGRRSAAFINYILGCPIANNRFFLIHRDGRPAGYFILNLVGRQSRIIDVFLDCEERAAWQAAYALAVQQASGLRGVCEIVGVASLPWLSELFTRAGFRLRQEKPIFLYDPRNQYGSLPPLLIQMVDSDAFFLYSPSYPYFT
jgi:hypothetical protein